MALWYIYEATYLSIIQLLKKDNKKNYNSKNISFALLKRKMLTSALRVLVNNPFKESFYGK